MDKEPIHPIRNVKFLRPQKVWGWEIAIYLYLAGMGAGSYIIGTIINWFINASRIINVLGFPLDIAKAALLWGPLLVVIGAPFLIFDLGKKGKFFTVCLNPRTSWVTRGFIILSVFILLGLTMLVLSTFLAQEPAKRTTLWLLLEVVSVLFAFATATYTGILLKSVKYISIWNSPLLEVLFFATALTTGLMGIILSTMGYSLLISSEDSLASMVQKLVSVEQILILIEGFVLALYLFSKFRTKDQSESSIRLLISGEMKIFFWASIVLTGFIFPLLLLSLNSYFPEYPIFLFASGISLLAGRFFLRLGILSVGIKDQIPMQRLIEIQYNLRTSTQMPKVIN